MGVSALGRAGFTRLSTAVAAFDSAPLVVLVGALVLPLSFDALVVSLGFTAVAAFASVVATDVGAVVAGSLGGPVVDSVDVTSAAFEVAGAFWSVLESS